MLSCALDVATIGPNPPSAPPASVKAKVHWDAVRARLVHTMVVFFWLGLTAKRVEERRIAAASNGLLDPEAMEIADAMATGLP